MNTPALLSRAAEGQQFPLPKEMFVVDTFAFMQRFSLYIGLLTLSVLTVVYSESWLVMLPVQVLIGVLFAHAVELQHECVHGLGFRSPALNKWVGRALGLPMLVSFTEYRARHLEHHKWLGTDKNSEFFRYSYEDLRSWDALPRHAYDFRRYAEVGRKMFDAALGRKNPAARTPEEERRIRNEYRGMLVLVVAAVVYSLVFHSLLVISVWLIPLIISAEAAHFLIELPEHIGCSTASRNVLQNTRTIVGNRFSQWLTVGNNFHVEHHLFPKVPVHRRHEVHVIVAPQLQHMERSYWNFLVHLLNPSDKE